MLPRSRSPRAASETYRSAAALNSSCPPGHAPAPRGRRAAGACFRLIGLLWNAWNFLDMLGLAREECVGYRTAQCATNDCSQDYILYACNEQRCFDCRLRGEKLQESAR